MTYYRIEYDLLMQLQGRNSKVSIQDPHTKAVQGSIDMMIAASFAPGKN